MAPGGRGSPRQGIRPFPSQQSEVQRLKDENESLVALLHEAKAERDRHYYNWIGTFSQLKNLSSENEELRKKLKDTRQAVGERCCYNLIETFPQLKTLRSENEELRKKLKDTRQTIGVLEDENENLEAKLSIASKEGLSSKAIIGGPTVTAKTSSSVPPAKSTSSPKGMNEFSPYGHVLPPALASEKMQSIIRRDLGEKSINSGIIYGFRCSSSSPLVKIGVTEDFNRRMTEHLRNDMANKHMVFRLESIHAGRFERLIHAHLRRERRQQPTGKDASGLEKRCHIEFFEVSDEMAISVAHGWHAWMACEPYMKVRSQRNVPEWKLKSEWNEKLSLFKNSHDWQNGWLEWLNSAVPGFIHDPISHLRAVQAGDISTRVVPIFDDSHEVHLEVKQEPDLDIYNSPATPEAAHIAAPIATLAAVEQSATEALSNFALRRGSWQSLFSEAMIIAK